MSFFLFQASFFTGGSKDRRWDVAGGSLVSAGDIVWDAASLMDNTSK